eukprot:m.1038084 g.1038084  ORF g.1038084 m.1038084 type:complete len:115 (+) comp24148_c0_seq1:2686-3030(+)
MQSFVWHTSQPPRSERGKSVVVTWCGPQSVIPTAVYVAICVLLMYPIPCNRDERGSTVGVNRSAVIACVQHPGELVYVPRLWAHSTVNLAEAVGIAVEYDGTSCTRRTCTKRFL